MKIKYLIRLGFVLIGFVIILSSLEIINPYYTFLIVIILFLTISLLRFYNSILKLETEIKILKNKPDHSEHISDLEKNYKPYFENNPNPMWVYDVKTLKFLDVNKAAVIHYGYTKKEFTSMKVTDICVKEESAKLYKNLTRPNSNFEITNSWHQLKKDGTIINVELFSHFIPVHNGLNSKIVLVKDLTEKYKLENELKESELKYRKLIQNAAVGIFYTDGEGNIQFVNSIAADMLGYSCEELLKMKITDIYAENEVEKVLDQINSLKPGSNIHIEPVMCRKDGTFVDVGISLSMLENGSSQAIVRNISSRKKKIKALHESEELFRKLSENSASAIFIFQEDGFKYVNHAAIRLTGYTKNEFMKMKFLDIIHPDFRETAIDKAKDRLTGKIDNSLLEIKILTKNGRSKWFEYNGTNIEIDGKPAVLGNAFDITDQKEAESLLKESESRFSAFMDSIPIGVFIADESSRFIYVNKQFQKIYNPDGEDLIGKNISDSPFIPQKIADKIIKDDKKALHDGPLTVIETIPDSKGIPHVYSTTKFPIRGINDKLLLGCYHIDITDKIEAEEELLRNKQDYQTFFENDLTGDYISTPKGQLKTCNPAFLKIFGFTSIDEAKETDLLKLYPDPKIREDLLKDLTLKKRLDEIEIVAQKIDGSKLYLIENIIGNFNDAGDLIEIRGYIIDNTHRKNAEIELRKLSRAVEQSSASIIITDTKGNIQYVNPKFESVTGYTFNEVIGSNPKLLNSGEKSNEEYRHLWETILSGNEWRGEFHNRKKNGSLYWELASISPIMNDTGEIENFLAVKEDITERKKAENSLIESEKKFRTLFESANEGTILLRDMVFVDCNEKALHIYKATKEQLLNKTPIDFSPEYQPDGEKSLIKAKQKIQAALDGTPQVFEWLHSKTDGTLFFAEVNLIKIEIDGINYIHAFVRDITEYKKSAETLKISEQKFKDIFNWAPVGIYQSLPDGKIITANSSLMHILGYDKIDDLLTCNMQDIYYNLEDRQKLLEKYDKPGAGAGIDIELLWKKKDGFPVWVSLTAYAVRYNMGKTIYFEGFVYDITERKAAETTLRESEERYRLLLQQSVEAIYLFDPITKRVIDTNPAFLKILGYTREEALSLTLYDFVEHDQENIDTYVEKSVITRGFTIGERVWKCKDGTLVDVEITTSQILQKGELLLFISARDITERKRAENALIEAKTKAEEMNKLKSIFLTNMSHELRTPLIGILGYSEMLTNDVSFAEQKEMAKTIFESGKRLHETLNLILELSKVESEINSVQLNPVNVYMLLEEGQKTFYSEVMQKGLRIQVLSKEQDIYAEADLELLRKVIYNLISNAIKYTSEGIITLSCTGENNKIEINVADTGIGIPAKDQEKIFEPFRQASEGFDRKFEGTGLGLTVAKKYMEMMNGKIHVKSIQGKGSTFILELPLSKNIPEFNKNGLKTAVNNHATASKSGNKSTTKKVLIVEDDNINIKVLAAFLKNDFSVDTVSNAQAAIQKSSENIYDCILMDIALGDDMNGSKAAKEIKKNEAYKNIPIVAMTAYAMEGDRERFLSGGCTHYIAKPFNKNDLISLVKNITNSERNINHVNQLKNKPGAH